MPSLTDQVAIITGASSGIGEATAVELAEEGASVVLAARREERLETVADRIKSNGGDALVAPTDITDDGDIVSLVETVQDEFGRIDIIVNNAGFGLYGSVEETPLEDARYQLEVNLFGQARLTQLVIPGMRERGYGKIINISSSGGKVWAPLGAWYHASKHAVEGFSDCLRYELDPHGIDVVIIEPGAIDTEWGEIAVENLREYSADGPYAELAESYIEATQDVDFSSEPEAVANTITDAVRSNSPKNRYTVGIDAKLMIPLRRFGGDRLYDRIIDYQF
ncbi:probable oxidoreductase (short-chain dehydrogenase family) (plasmid) [Halobacterium hubeiense]|uniref:Probable oxidoreductase (Short-chain dehydrogenase family) n=1 Tax=Halobacterium hubeiense TaxID=1407499 RepID=A0A0U5H5L6_9EURY|nr:oxidoreductase [Halobacterium hubeiense]CQH64762.1 probable oxidoreductase (short-chain dehydrogenase family) [Halobacterium hubeiense]